MVCAFTRTFDDVSCNCLRSLLCWLLLASATLADRRKHCTALLNAAADEDPPGLGNRNTFEEAKRAHVPQCKIAKSQLPDYPCNPSIFVKNGNVFGEADRFSLPIDSVNGRDSQPCLIIGSSSGDTKLEQTLARMRAIRGSSSSSAVWILDARATWTKSLTAAQYLGDLGLVKRFQKIGIQRHYGLYMDRHDSGVAFRIIKLDLPVQSALGTHATSINWGSHTRVHTSEKIHNLIREVGLVVLAGGNPFMLAKHFRHTDAGRGVWNVVQEQLAGCKAVLLTWSAGTIVAGTFLVSPVSQEMMLSSQSDMSGLNLLYPLSFRPHADDSDIADRSRWVASYPGWNTADFICFYNSGGNETRVVRMYDDEVAAFFRGRFTLTGTVQRTTGSREKNSGPSCPAFIR